MQRRTFLAGAAGLIASACTSGSDQSDTPAPNTASTSTAPATSDTGTTPPSPDETATSQPPEAAGRSPFVPARPTAPFAYGVASGDPTATSVTLWTRLVDGDGGRVSATDETLTWSVASDPGFTEIVATGTIGAADRDGGSAHVTVPDLTPDSVYYYGFTWGDSVSITGRTWTMPRAEERRPVRIAALSCQHYEEGFFGAYRGIEADDPDLVVHLGDYIYERPAANGPGAVRTHRVSRPADLAGFRALWGSYRSDPHLQDSHASRPWLVMWDDHEIGENHAGRDLSASGTAAYQAWFEHQPTSAPRPDPATPFVTHRLVELGPVRLWLLDTRQYRSPQVCDRLPDLPAAELCADALDPTRTILGDEQEAWLEAGVDPADGRWDVFAQQVVMADLSVDVGSDTGVNNDQWDGYPAARSRLLDLVADHDRSLVLSGDLHAAMANTVAVDSSSGSMAEIVVPSVTTRMSPTTAAGLTLLLFGSEFVHLFEPEIHGYVIVDFTEELARASFRVTDTSSADAATTTAHVFDVAAGSSTPVRH